MTRMRGCLSLALLPCLVAIMPAMAQAPSGVPVTTVMPVRQDVPVVARAIGTVQPNLSVVIRARVDGTLDQVAFTEGQMVKAGDLLAQIDPRGFQAVLDQALARRSADEAALANARADLVRYSDLAQSQVASRQRLELQRANVAQAEAALRGSEATIAAAQLNLSFARITSPIDGRVGLRQIDAGNLVRTADPNSSGIVTVTQIHPIGLMYTLPQDTLPQLRAAMRRGKVPVMAYSSDDKILLSRGELLTLDNAIDPATGTVRLKAIFPNLDDALWPGQFINVRTQLDVKQGVLTLPSIAVQRGQNGLFVYAVKPDGTASVQPVEVDQDNGQLAVVTAGLDGNEHVVQSGQSRLSNGARVIASEAKSPADSKVTGQEATGAPRT